MNEKLSLQDLANVLSKQARISNKDSELFLKELFDLILERIYVNDPVKVKDFGTFKLVPISSRQSVDVNTGEKIEIPAHYRFSFVADRALKELVNIPYSKLETVLLEDGMDPSDVVFDVVDGDEDEDDSDDVTTIESNEVAKVIQEQAKIIDEIKRTKEPISLLANKSNSISGSKLGTKEDRFDKENVSTLSSIGTQGRLPKLDDKLDPEKKLRDLNLPREKRIIELREPIRRGSGSDLPKPENKLNRIEISTFKPSKKVEKEKNTTIEEKSILDRPLIPTDTSSKSVSSESKLQIPKSVPSIDTKTDSIETNLAALANRINENTEKERLVVEEIQPLVESAELVSDNTEPITNSTDSVVSDTNLSEQVDEPFDLKHKLSFFQRVKKIWFLWFAGIATLGVVAYSLFSLFEVEYDYEKYMNSNANTSLSITDTLPDLYVEDMAEELLADTNVVIVDDALDDTLGYTRVFTQKLNNFEVSKSLNIPTVNKANLYLNKLNGKQTVNESATDSFKIQDKVILASGMTLRSLAKKYYGNTNYWIYIYVANKASGFNPDNLEVGKELVIPTLAQFDITDPSDIKSVEKALKLEKELLKQ